MKLFINKLRNNWAVIILIVLSCFLALTNYTPGAFLSGWDTLHPEFNFGLNFERVINGVFREEQGLGTVAGHSHMADLPRILLLFPISFVLPVDLLRYFYVFLNLIIGPIGMYFFLKRVVVKNEIASFLGSLFYLLNLGTMQQFIVPFEMFVTQYGMLPWLFLTATGYLNKPNRKNIILFSIVTLFSTPMAYAATLWYIYFGCLILYLLFYSFHDFVNKKLQTLKKNFILLFLTLLINSFWILPNLYFLKTEAKNVPEAKINKLFSSQAFLYNKEFGNFKDISLIKTFLFDWNVYAGNNKFEYLLNPWIKHLSNPSVEKIGFISPILAIFGIIFALKKKNKVGISILPLLACSLFFLINDNFPTGIIYKYFQANLPLFNEALRFPDDKVLGVFTFVLALYIGLSIAFIINFAKKLLKKPLLIKNFQFTFSILFFILLTIYMFPAFSGNLISPNMRIKIPNEYFELFKWFKNQPNNGRIANLPINSLWGWEYYDWHRGQKPSFQGAGFLWFGIKQPIMQRDFDRWNPSNEQYYREMSNAIYSQDAVKLSSVVRKYSIKYILLDKNIIGPEQRTGSEVLFFNEIEKLLEKSFFVQKVVSFGKLSIYEANYQTQNVSVIKNPPSMPAFNVSYDDFAYLKYKNYITYTKDLKNEILFPFKDMIDNQNHFLPKTTINSSNFDITLNLNKQNFTYSIPSSTSQPENYDITLIANKNSTCQFNNQLINKAEKNILNDQSGNFIRYESSENSFCEYFSYNNLPRDQGYLISIVARNITGLPIKVCVSNYISKRCDINTSLSESKNFEENVFLLPSMNEGNGFNVNIENFAIKGTPSINDLKSIKITPFPYTWISQIEANARNNSELDINVLKLDKAFEKNWKAYEVENSNFLTNALPFFFGKELKEHVLVNNWANGWVIENGKLKIENYKTVIIFWPQYLEYLGFALLIGTFVWIIMRRKPKQQSFL